MDNLSLPGLSSPSAPGEALVDQGVVAARVLLLRGIALRAIGITTNFALLALVFPSDLGLLAVVRGTFGVFQLASELGFELALVRRREEPTREELAALVGQRTFILLVLVGAAAVVPQVRTAFGLVPAELSGLMLAALASLLITPLQSACRVVLERRLKFTQVAIVEVNAQLLQSVGLLLFALGGLFREGIFLTQIALSLYSTVALRRAQPVPSPSFEVRSLRPLWGVGLGFSATAIIGGVRDAFTPILIAKLFGLDIAGFWTFAARVGQLLLVTIEGYYRAGVAVAAHLVGNPAMMHKFATRILEESARLTFPAVGLLYAALPVVAGWFPRWAAGVEMAQVYVLALGLLGVMQAALFPAAIARWGPRATLGEHTLSFLTVGVGLVLLWAVGGDNIAIPFTGALLVSLGYLLWLTEDRWRPHLGRVFWRSLVVLASSVVLLSIAKALGAGVIVAAAVASALPVAILTVTLVRMRFPLAAEAGPLGTAAE